MIEYFFSLPRWYFGLLATLFSILGVVFWHAFTSYRTASEKFKNIIYTQLKGISPKIVVYIDPKKIEEQIINSIIPIKTGGEIFKDSLPSFCVGCFSRALDHYCETARKTDWNEQLAHQQYPEMATPGYISPKEKLNKAVNDLLKFAK